MTTAKELTTDGYPCTCPECGWKGDSLDAHGFRYADDEDGPYCPKCFANGEGKLVYCDDDEFPKLKEPHE